MTLPAIRWLGFLLGRGTHPNDKWANLGTQFLSENLKSRGVHGLIYDSSATNRAGLNFALFSDQVGNL